MGTEKMMIDDLAMIGDRRTCALLNKKGSIVWYCPKRFDSPSLFAYLLDTTKGGSWSFDIKECEFESRNYLEDSALLQTRFSGKKGQLILEDWMPLMGSFYGICRELSASPVFYSMQLTPRPNYARQTPVIHAKSEKHATIEYDYHFYSSHALHITESSISCSVPAGEKAWFILAEKALDNPKAIERTDAKQLEGDFQSYYLRRTLSRRSS